MIPKGWKVQLWYRGVHLDPQFYPQPKVFNPARWDVSSQPANSFRSSVIQVVSLVYVGPLELIENGHISGTDA